MPGRSTHSRHFGEVYEDFGERGKESCACTAHVEGYSSLDILCDQQRIVSKEKKKSVLNTWEASDMYQPAQWKMHIK